MRFEKKMVSFHTNASDTRIAGAGIKVFVTDREGNEKPIRVILKTVDDSDFNLDKNGARPDIDLVGYIQRIDRKKVDIGFTVNFNAEDYEITQIERQPNGQTRLQLVNKEPRNRIDKSPEGFEGDLSS